MAKTDRCMHDLLRSTCDTCSPVRSTRTPNDVYITDGGSRFQVDPRCWGLEGGQAGADALGLRVHDIRSVPVATAANMWLTRCQVCG